MFGTEKLVRVGLKGFENGKISTVLYMVPIPKEFTQFHLGTIILGATHHLFTNINLRSELSPISGLTFILIYLHRNWEFL